VGGDPAEEDAAILQAIAVALASRDSDAMRKFLLATEAALVRGGPLAGLRFDPSRFSFVVAPLVEARLEQVEAASGQLGLFDGSTGSEEEDSVEAILAEAYPELWEASWADRVRGEVERALERRDVTAQQRLGVLFASLVPELWSSSDGVQADPLVLAVFRVQLRELAMSRGELVGKLDVFADEVQRGTLSLSELRRRVEEDPELLAMAEGLDPALMADAQALGASQVEEALDLLRSRKPPPFYALDEWIWILSRLAEASQRQGALAAGKLDEAAREAVVGELIEAFQEDPVVAAMADRLVRRAQGAKRKRDRRRYLALATALGLEPGLVVLTALSNGRVPLDHRSKAEVRAARGLLGREPPTADDVEAYARWLDAAGEAWRAARVREAAEGYLSACTKPMAGLGSGAMEHHAD